MTDLARETDVVVIGAGPAGTYAAAVLRAAGHEVTVIERARFPRFVIGESLLPRCMDLLEEAGLLERIASEGYLKKHGAVFARDEERCGFDFADQHGGGWAYTWQVPRDSFDQALAEEVQSRGVSIHFEHAVRSVELGGSPRVTVQTPDGAERDVSCRFVVDASGYGRVLPRLLGLERPSELPPRRSVFTHVRGDRRPAGDDEGHIWIAIHEGAWIWVIPFHDGRTSVGVVAEPAFYDAYPEDPAEQLTAILEACPVTRDRLGGVELLWPPRVIEGYSVGVERLWGEGFCLVGNATEFLDPVFSSGVTLALESASLASKALVRKLAGETVDWDEEYATPITAGIDVFRAYVGWWYDGTLPWIFFHPESDPDTKKRICAVLAGYVWDESNPFVRSYRRKIPQVVRLLGG